MKRADLRRARQEAHHDHQISRARYPRHKLSAACQYLIAEVGRADDFEATRATEMVLDYVRELRARTRSDDEEGTQP